MGVEHHMGIRQLLPAAIAASLLVPASAFAGAPNYDCTIRGGHARLAIDQWRPKVVAMGLGAPAGVSEAVSDIVQNGGSLDLVTTLAGVRWRVAVRDYGRSLTMTSPGSTLTGRCLFIPGNFILRTADHGGFRLRSAPRPTASGHLAVRVGEPVWETPDVYARGKWLPVRVIHRKGLALATANGWLRQVGPYQARAN
ncbi:MAG: hypothetical protein ABI317_11785 [Gaiellales bacterium]